MGGMNSGRTGGRPTIEGTGSYVLGLKGFRIPSGRTVCQCVGRFDFADGFAVRWTYVPRDEGAYFEFRHEPRAGDEDEVAYRVYLNWSKPHFGGRRWWWICPRTGERATKLYLPLGGYQFWSREGYRLRYSSQRETKTDRLARKARKLDRRLGGEGCFWGETAPDKPKWMRWRTYDRLASRLADAWGQADALWFEQAKRLIARL